jgi:hypothetical protein
MLKHEAIILFFLVTAYILDHVMINTGRSLSKKTDLRVSTTWARDAATADTRASRNAVLSHL